MKTTRIVCAIAALSLGLGNVAFAQGDRHDERHDNDHHPSQMHHEDRHDSGPSEHHDRDARHDEGLHREAHYDRHDERRGAGPEHRFYRGDRLPPEFRSRQYVVDDWRGHYLRRPPRGYHWVQAGDDYVLAAIATGVIASILLNAH